MLFLRVLRVLRVSIFRFGFGFGFGSDSVPARELVTDRSCRGEGRFDHRAQRIDQGARFRGAALRRQGLGIVQREPGDQRMARTVAVAHRLVGWHAVAERGRELGISLSEAAAREAAARIKALGDEHDLDGTMVDEVIYEYAE